MPVVPGEENETPEGSGLPEGVPTEDPFPRIFIVCFAIFVVLGVLIFGVIAYDLTQRVDKRVLPASSTQETPENPAPDTP